LNPQITAFQIDKTAINENESVTLTGSFTDVGLLDTATLQINWGDGNTSAATVDQVNRTFEATHQYFDDNPTATPLDENIITGTLTDDDGGVTFDTAIVTVQNLDPTLVLN
jgi:hypothetical protein